MNDLLDKVINKIDLSESESIKVMNYFTSGDASNAYIASMLTALRMKGETAIEITGFVKVMRDKARRIKTPNAKCILDVVGTGGDKMNTFNISTLSAIVAAGAGVTVAKHGNRSVTSKCGSAEVLSSLGVNLEASPEMIESVLESAGLAFLFAPGLHPSMKHVMPVRKSLQIRTVFNILGPLVNPAFADTMLIGVYDTNLLYIFAEVLSNLGLKRFFVVHGNDGSDEISLTSKTQVLGVVDGLIQDFTLNPEDYGFSLVNMDELQGGESEENKNIALSVLEGKKGPQREVVLLNAGVAIALTLNKVDIAEGIRLAKESIDSGKALEKLIKLARGTNG